MSDSAPADAIAPRELVTEAAAHLAAAGIEPARFEAQVILAHVLGTKPSHLLLEARPVPPDATSRFRRLVTQRAARVPLQYVIGTHEFMDLTIACRPGVFIPRPETELLVEVVIEALRALPTGALSVADIGCGTGAVAIAIAHYVPSATVHAVDVSPEAVQLTAENARRLGVADRVVVYEGDLLASLRSVGVAEGLDVIVANLPYIPTADIETLAPEIRDHEPRGALDGGPDGLRHFRRLVSEMATLPPRERLVALEVGAGQTRAVEQMLQSGLHCADTQVRRDYSGIERIVLARSRPIL